MKNDSKVQQRLDFPVAEPDETISLEISNRTLDEGAIPLIARIHDTSAATLVRFRRKISLLTQLHEGQVDTPLSLLTFPGEAVSQFDWHTILEYDKVAPSIHTVDDDLPDIDLDLARPVRRALGALYSYRVEYFGEAPDGDLVFVGASPEVHTRRRLLAMPFDVTLVSGSDQLRIHWKSDSVCAEGFVVKVTDTDSGGNRVAYVNGHDKTSLAFHGLTPATNYAIKVQAFDYYGRSGVAYAEEATKPAPSEPEVQTFTVALNREQVYEGFVPYVGYFPTGGAALPKGTLQTVSLLPGWPSLFFPKPGFSTQDCDNPDAVVTLQPGNSLSGSQMKDLFGSQTPSLPVLFVACAEATPALYNYVPIKIEYRKD